MPLKICYLANAQSVHTQRWVGYFADRGHDVYVITFNETEQMKGVKIRKLRYVAKFMYPFRILEVRRAVKKVDPDILHAHYVSHYGAYAALTRLKPLVVSAWGSDVLVDPKKSVLKKYTVKYVLEKADLVTVDSITSMKTVIELGADERKVKLIVHGVNLREFCPIDNKEKLKEQLGMPSSYQIVISTRNLEPIYDIGTIIKAIPCVIDECPDTCFLIVGDGSLRRQLERLTLDLGVKENVRFVGSVPYDEMPKFVGISDIYVSTSLSDTTSVSLLEAMACKLPVVTTDLEGNREWIRNGANGFLFPKGDFEALAKNILYLLKDEDIRRKFGIANRATMEMKGDYLKEMSRMEKLYKDLVEACRA